MKSAFDGAGGVELATECGGEGVEGLVVVAGKENGVLGMEAEFDRVGGGAGFAFGCGGAG